MTREELLRELEAELATGHPGPPVDPPEVKQRRLLRLDRAMRRRTGATA